MAEGILSRMLAECGVEALRAMEVFLPTRVYTDNERKQRLAEKKIDATLEVRRVGGEEKMLHYQGNLFVPGVSIRRESSGFYEVRMYDVSSGRAVWVGTAEVTWSGDLRRSLYEFSDEVMRHLSLDGIIARKKKKWPRSPPDEPL